MRRFLIAALLVLLPGLAVGQDYIRYSPPSNVANRVLYADAPALATAGTSEETILTWSLPANTLAVNGQAIRITFLFTTAANANSKIARVRFGSLIGQAICGVSTTSSGYLETCTATCVRSSTSILDCWTLGIAGSGVQANAVQVTSLNFTAAIPILITGQTATSAADMTLASVRIEGP